MLEAKEVVKSFDGFRALDSATLTVPKGTVYGLVGPNGAGKSTFLKILSGQLEPTNGDVVITPGQRLSFLQQDHFKYDAYPVLDTVIMGNARLYEIMKEKEAIYMKEDFSEEDGVKAAELEGEFATMNGWEAESDAANLLNGLGIETDLHYKQMADLTGAQKVKVLLAQALFGNPDILLLDEPTNHLDIDSKAILENAINQFEGTVLYVSHDRYFINTTAHRILDLTNHTILNYIGNYDYYLEKKDAIEQANLTSETVQTDSKKAPPESISKETNKLSWQQQKEEQARLRKIENELRKVEQEIEALEADNEALDEALADPANATNSAKLQELSTKHSENDARLEQLMERWEELSEST